MSTKEAFHAAERELQAREGMQERMSKVGQKVIRAFMPQQHRDFYADQRWLFVGSLDQQGNPWASVIWGGQGFASSPTPETLDVNFAAAKGDPLQSNLKPGGKLGLLGLSFHTRRRNRVNGYVDLKPAEHHFVMHVDQSFGNCPKYIQARSAEPLQNVKTLEPQRMTQIDSKLKEALQQADTFFIASAYDLKLDQQDNQTDPRAGGVDISHRGGAPGFVEVVDDKRFRYPDYSGNFHFNTLGNLHANPRSGYLFIDFETGDLWQLIGKTTIIWDQGSEDWPPGALRMLEFEMESALHHPAALPFQWTFLESSRYLP